MANGNGGPLVNLVGLGQVAKAMVRLNYPAALTYAQNGDYAGALIELAAGADNGMAVGWDWTFYKYMKKVMPAGGIDTGFMKFGY